MGEQKSLPNIEVDRAGILKLSVSGNCQIHALMREIIGVGLPGEIPYILSGDRGNGIAVLYPPGTKYRELIGHLERVLWHEKKWWQFGVEQAKFNARLAEEERKREEGAEVKHEKDGANQDP